jgi:hypothetical protein
MAKPLEKGKVKTRLAVDTSDDFALKIYQELLNYTFDVVEDSAIDSRIYYAWPPKERVQQSIHFVQDGQDLGERMHHAFEESFAAGYEHILMIGADCPVLTVSHLEQGFLALEDHDIVTGPSEDGGYYLIGMKKLRSRLLTDLPWSTDRLHELSIERIREHGWSHKTLELLFDVDRIEDLEKATFTAQWNKF